MNLREPIIKRIVQLMKDPQKGVAIKDRTFHFQLFTASFVGTEYVNWALLNSVADTRDHAVLLGQELLDRGFIFHASNDQPFRDGYFFYTFQKFPEISDAEMDIMVIRMKAHPTGVSIQDRSHHLRNYRDCFVGSEAVDWFIKNVPKYAPQNDRQLAVKLGQEMMNKGIMHSATQNPFSDGPDFYYFQKNIQSGYLGKLSKERTMWKLRWFAIKDVKEKKLWYFNSPRDPVPRDFINLSGAYLRVVLDQEIGYFEICTSLRVFSLRPTSSSLLARWVSCLSEFVGNAGFEDNLTMERSERSISVHECGVSSKTLKEKDFPIVGLSLEEVVSSGLFDDSLNTSSDSTLNNSFDLHLYNHTFNDAETSTETNTETNTNTNHEETVVVPKPKKLELMRDDLDIFQVDDTPFHSPKVDYSSEQQYQTQYEDGFMGEVNYLPPPCFSDHCEHDNTDHENNIEENKKNTEIEELISRLSEHLSTTESSGFMPATNTLIPVTHVTDIIPTRDYLDPYSRRTYTYSSEQNSQSNSHSSLPIPSAHSLSALPNNHNSTGRSYQGFHFM